MRRPVWPRRLERELRPAAPPACSPGLTPRGGARRVLRLAEDTRERAMPGGKLIVVSNRLPLSLRHSVEGWVAEPSSGGLASAVNPLLKSRGGLWIGWPGHAPRSADEGREDLLRHWAQTEGYAAV